MAEWAGGSESTQFDWLTDAMGWQAPQCDGAATRDSIEFANGTTGAQRGDPAAGVNGGDVRYMSPVRLSLVHSLL